MKKLICILLSLLICIGLCGCNIFNFEDTESTPNSQPTEAETNSDTEVETKDTAESETEITTETKSETEKETEIKTEIITEFETVELRTEIDYSTKNVEELEDLISSHYQLRNFKLVRIHVDIYGEITDSKEKIYHCSLDVEGNYGASQELKWEKYCSITKDVFQSLYDLNDDYVVYNSEITPVYDSLVTNIPQPAINSICNIIIDPNEIVETKKATKIDHLEFLESLNAAGFEKYLPKDEFFEVMGQYTCNGESIVDGRVLHSSGMYSEGYIVYLLKSGTLANEYEKSRDGTYEIYTNTLKTRMDLGGLTLPYGITFDDTLKIVFEKMGYANTPYDCFVADDNFQNTMTLYEKNGESLVYYDFQITDPRGEYIIPYVLEYTGVDRYLLEDGEVGTLNKRVTISFSSEGKLYEVEMSVSEEHGTPPANKLPSDMPVFGRVEHVDETGIVVDLVGIGEVYIKGVTGFDMFDSVAVTYNLDDLVKDVGKRPSYSFGVKGEIKYEYVLIDYIELRFTDPSKGEPLYD